MAKIVLHTLATKLLLLSLVVIDRKGIFLFRPKANIWQENAAEYSADNEYSAKEENVAQKEKNENNVFLGLQLQVSGSCKLSRFIRSNRNIQRKNK
jgi:hypothetical protein